MKLIRELNEAASPCAAYFDETRIDDFAMAIKELMDDGMEYEDAKAAAFDETRVPKSGSECDKKLRSVVDALK